MQPHTSRYPRRRYVFNGGNAVVTFDTTLSPAVRVVNLGPVSQREICWLTR